ncbi:hypothetical protein RclHR1_10990002 [Rhizophagus clarus]|nr:hypothetical protein RclHR1_10990002 [Rhizophagus clarus]
MRSHCPLQEQSNVSQRLADTYPVFVHDLEMEATQREFAMRKVLTTIKKAIRDHWTRKALSSTNHILLPYRFYLSSKATGFAHV